MNNFKFGIVSNFFKAEANFNKRFSVKNSEYERLWNFDRFKNGGVFLYFSYTYNKTSLIDIFVLKFYGLSRRS